jgi:hypothetical protein
VGAARALQRGSSRRLQGGSLAMATQQVPATELAKYVVEKGKPLFNLAD